jgi:hypothetical protein
MILDIKMYKWKNKFVNLNLEVKLNRLIITKKL